MDVGREVFEPPAPTPRSTPPGWLTVINTVLRNPLELWGEPSYNRPWIVARFFNQRSLIANHPDLIRHILVENAANYRMQTVRQLVLRPILRDGLLTAEGPIWRRTRKAIAPVFTPRHAKGFAAQMHSKSVEYVEQRYGGADGSSIVDVSEDMNQLTFAILSETLFSGELAVPSDSFSADTERLLQVMGRIDPMDLLQAPAWMPRPTRIGGEAVLKKFRDIVQRTIDLRRRRLHTEPENAPRDFLTLMLERTGEHGLTEDELQDNILTFIGAGHETTSRALAWTLYCVALSPVIRDRMEAEIDEVVNAALDPVEWLDRLPYVRAAFEEAMRLYPPAPSINREAIAADSWVDETGERVEIAKGMTVLVMPWTLHRHELLWERPRAFLPERFLPENRETIDRFQYLPFGAGPRVCIGASFAMQEAVIALGVMMSRYRFDVTTATKPWPIQRLTVQPQSGLPMRVSPRY